jgi:hypothetical protein
MRVAVMDVGIVGMSVAQHLVLMRVRMRLRPVPFEGVLVPVMLVMPVALSVCQRKVGVFVLMSFAHVQPHPNGHESGGGPKVGPRQPGP